MMKEVRLYLNNAGFCYAKESHAIKGGSDTDIKFSALYGLIYHEQQGWILFDTGYTERFYTATKFFPDKIYALLTKVSIDPYQEVKEQIKNFGLKCSDIKHIIISHFHADHIGGLKDFENAVFYCSRKAYSQAKNINRHLGFTKGVLKSLIPVDFENRVKFIEDTGTPLRDDIFGLKFDLFKDNSILTYDLPGHAEGQIGIELKTKAQHYFLIADACWFDKAYKDLSLPHPIVRLFFSSWKDYKETINKIHQYHQKYPDINIVPSHCSLTTEALIPKSYDLDVL